MSHFLSLPSLPFLSHSLLSIRPVFILATTKSISCLAWIPFQPYESIIVAFLFDSAVDIIDCNKGHVHGRLVTKKPTRRGFTKIHILPSTDLSVKSSWSYLIAGNSYGQLFMWRFPNTITGDLYTAHPIWEALGDPTSQPNESLGIVGIFTPCHTEMITLLLTLTRSGHLCLWDVMNSSLLSFSSTQTPLLIQTSSIWGGNSAAARRSLISTADIDQNEPLSISSVTLSSAGKKLYTLHGKIFLILSSGERFQFNLSSATFTPLRADSRFIRPSSSQVVIVQDTLQPWKTGTVVSNQNPLVAHNCDVKGIDFMSCPCSVSNLPFLLLAPSPNSPPPL